MKTIFSIRSSDPLLFEKATRVAKTFAKRYFREGIVGVMLLGAIPRGYFDASADIDLAIFQDKTAKLPIPEKFGKVEGLEVHCWWSVYEDELVASWEMGKRWTYSQGQVLFDPSGRLASLLVEKIPLQPEERKWLLMSGLVLSEWYINRLTLLWLERGSMSSAQDMFTHGLSHFYDLLFGLNNELVPDMKWRLYCAERLERLPENFAARLQEIHRLRSISTDELERRKGDFMEMWREMQPIIEKEVGMTFNEMVNQV